MTDLKTAIAIARVSTDRQAREDKVSHEDQLWHIGQWAQENGYRVVEEHRESLSGTTDLDAEQKELRPIFWGAWDRLKAGDVDAIIFWDPTRFCRDAKMSGLKFGYWLMESRNYGDGIRFTSAEPARDTDMDGLHAYLQGFSGGQEWKNIVRRAVSSRSAYFAKGQKAQGKDPFGYRWNKDERRYMAVPQEAKSVRLIYNLYGQGLSLSRLAEHLLADGIQSPGKARGYRQATDYWDVTTLRYILRNPMYHQGHLEVKYQGTVYTLPADPIVGVDIAKAATDALKQRRRFRRRPGSLGLFQGRISCGHCGRTYIRGSWTVKGHGHGNWYYCQGRMRSQTIAKGKPKCDVSPLLLSDKTDAALWEAIAALLVDGEQLQVGAETFLAGLNAEIAKLAPSIASIENEVGTLEAERETRVEAWVKFKGNRQASEEAIAKLDRGIEEKRQYLTEHKEDEERLHQLERDADAIRASLESGLTSITRIDDLGEERKVRVHLEMEVYINEDGQPEVTTPTGDNIIELDFTDTPPVSTIDKGQLPAQGEMRRMKGSFVTNKDTLLELLRVNVVASGNVLQVKGVVSANVLHEAVGVSTCMSTNIPFGLLGSLVFIC